MSSSRSYPGEPRCGVDLETCVLLKEGRMLHAEPHYYQVHHDFSYIIYVGCFAKSVEHELVMWPTVIHSPAYIVVVFC